MAYQVARDVFVVGLRNAHAMEVQARELMERQSERLTDFPKLQVRVRQHLSETNEQLRRLEQCLDALNESHSTLKDAAMSTLANLAALGHAVAGDEILKNTFANNAFEHYEIAVYKALLVLAKQSGASSTEPPLRQSLEEEHRMAAWIEDNIEDITLSYLAEEERKKTAA